MDVYTGHPTSVLSICAGVGGLDIGVNLATGARTVCYIERESFPASIIVARMEDQALDKAPVWDDLTTFNGRAWRGKVDTIVAGFPCQPVSHAGKRRGSEDDRWIWDDIVRIICEVRPRFIFLENVSGILSMGCGAVLRDLAKVGYDAEWGVLSAGSIGAPHRRNRWFCLAYPNSVRDERFRRPGPVAEEDQRYNREARGGQWGRDTADYSVKDVALFPPGPSDREGWERFLGEFPTAKPAICRDANGSSYRMDRLRALGNGCCPLQAAVAFHLLSARAGFLNDG